MNLPSDYDSARGFDGSSQQTLTPGGHICRIMSARVEKTKKTGRDMLVVAFDIVEGGEFDDYYKAQYERRKSYNSEAKWPGVFRATILNSEGKTNGFFKGFIEAVEASNAGYSFRAVNGDENTLKGKMVGFNFGEEEYEYTDRQTGEIKVGVSCKPAYAVSVAKVREGVVPPEIKRLNRPTSYAPAGSMAAQGFTEVDDDDLPF